MCPAIKNAGDVETMAVVAVEIVAVIAVAQNRRIFNHYYDAQSWAAARGGHVNEGEPVVFHQPFFCAVHLAFGIERLSSFDT